MGLLAALQNSQAITENLPFQLSSSHITHIPSSRAYNSTSSTPPPSDADPHPLMVLGHPGPSGASTSSDIYPTDRDHDAVSVSTSLSVSVSVSDDPFDAAPSSTPTPPPSSPEEDQEGGSSGETEAKEGGDHASEPEEVIPRPGESSFSNHQHQHLGFAPALHHPQGQSQQRTHSEPHRLVHTQPPPHSPRGPVSATSHTESAHGTDKEMKMGLNNLPYDLLLNIASYLDLYDIHALQLTSKNLYDFSTTRPVYRKLANDLLRRCRALPLKGFQRLTDLTTEQLIRSVNKATRYEVAWRYRAPRPITVPSPDSILFGYEGNPSGSGSSNGNGSGSVVANGTVGGVVRYRRGFDGSAAGVALGTGYGGSMGHSNYMDLPELPSSPPSSGSGSTSIAYGPPSTSSTSSSANTSITTSPPLPTPKNWYKIVSAPPGEEVDWLSPITSSYTLCATKSGKVVCWDVQTDSCLAEWNPGARWELWKCRVEFEERTVFFTMARVLSGSYNDERIMEFVLMKLCFFDSPSGHRSPDPPIFSHVTEFKTTGVVMNVFLLDPSARLLSAFIWVASTNTIGLYALLDWDKDECVFVDTGIECVVTSNWSCILYENHIVIHCEESDAAYQHFYPIDLLRAHSKSLGDKKGIPTITTKLRPAKTLTKKFIFPRVVYGEGDMDEGFEDGDEEESEDGMMDGEEETASAVDEQYTVQHQHPSDHQHHQQDGHALQNGGARRHEEPSSYSSSLTRSREDHELNKRQTGLGDGGDGESGFTVDVGIDGEVFYDWKEPAQPSSVGASGSSSSSNPASASASTSTPVPTSLAEAFHPLRVISPSSTPFSVQYLTLDMIGTLPQESGAYESALQYLQEQSQQQPLPVPPAPLLYPQPLPLQPVLSAQAAALSIAQLAAHLPTPSHQPAQTPTHAHTHTHAHVHQPHHHQHVPASHQNPFPFPPWYPESAHFVRQWWPSLPGIPRVSCTVVLLASHDQETHKTKFVLAQHYFRVPLSRMGWAGAGMGMGMGIEEGKEKSGGEGGRRERVVSGRDVRSGGGHEQTMSNSSSSLSVGSYGSTSTAYHSSSSTTGNTTTGYSIPPNHPPLHTTSSSSSPPSRPHSSAVHEQQRQPAPLYTEEDEELDDALMQLWYVSKPFDVVCVSDGPAPGAGGAGGGEDEDEMELGMERPRPLVAVDFGHAVWVEYVYGDEMGEGEDEDGEESDGEEDEDEEGDGLGYGYEDGEEEEDEDDQGMVRPDGNPGMEDLPHLQHHDHQSQSQGSSRARYQYGLRKLKKVLRFVTFPPFNENGIESDPVELRRERERERRAKAKGKGKFVNAHASMNASFVEHDGVDGRHAHGTSGISDRWREGQVRTLDIPAELDLDSVETINIDQSQGAVILSVKEGRIFILCYE
ncbi:hypothetical protein AX16_002871 [Volvariella volvacea WC 439]|nr:hypothetical protein AX16_002871 [Volvariella volvacea WC 439]